MSRHSSSGPAAGSGPTAAAGRYPEPAVSILVLLRHGKSTWNQEKRFTGWTDVDLTAEGEDEARGAGRSLRQSGIDPDVVHTSVLVRAVRTATIALEEAGRTWIPVRRHWRLNERHYGALQGYTHAEMAEKYSPEQVHTWRRSYDVRPPLLEASDERHPLHDERYRGIPPDALPGGECLADVVARMVPYWHDSIAPDLAVGRIVLVSAHGNSLRALFKHLEGIPDEDIPALEIPTGVPRVYRFEAGFKLEDAYYLG